MAASQIDRVFAALDLLSHNATGATLADIAAALSMPRSGAHRLLADLIRLGYARQDEAGRYGLTTRLASLAFRHLSASGVTDAARPILDGLARLSGDLVRLSVTDGERQIWVAKAQGARPGLIFDPQMGEAAHPSAMATGLAWLARLPEAEALRIALASGLAPTDAYGPNAPRTPAELIERLAQTRRLGHALAVESSAPGMSAIAAAILHPGDGRVLGTISIGGPSARLTPERLAALSPALTEAAAALAAGRAGSALLSSTLSGGAAR
jgi:DNA-binding IclR family transcriptional regulator